MFNKSPIDWSEIPESVPGLGHRLDLNRFESLEEGRIQMPVPLRVQSGSVLEACLTLETSQGLHNIRYNQIEFMALGLIIQQIGPGREAKSSMRMKIREVLLGDPERKIKAKYQSFNHLLDIYLLGVEAPFRIDQSNVSYRSLLNRPGYVSIVNFRQVVEKITAHAGDVPLDSNLNLFLKSPKEPLATYRSVSDFQMDCRVFRFRLQNPAPVAPPENAVEKDSPVETETQENKNEEPPKGGPDE